MAKIKLLNGWHINTEFTNSFDNPKHKLMLDNMTYHLKHECLQDPEIFFTMFKSPYYRFYGSFQNASFQGMDKVKEFYYSLWNSSSSLVEFAIHRCLPGDWGQLAMGNGIHSCWALY